MEGDGPLASLGDLLSVSTMTLATVGLTGEPHAAPVYFAADPQLRFYFFSETSSQHAQDVHHEPRAAATLYPECFDWQDIRGIQMRGIVQPVNAGEQWEIAWEMYESKFPFVSEMKEIVARNQLYIFSPTWMRLIDNRRGFGFKKEWSLK
jgi:uncharacterized protein